MKLFLNLTLFILFSFIGMQVPQAVENYKIGASAVVAELENDYNRISTIAKTFNLTIEQLLEEAKKTNNIYAKKIIGIQEEKIPRYLALKAQVNTLNSSKDIFKITKIVFVEHDSALWQNVKNTYQVGLYLNLDTAWYFAIFTTAFFLTFIFNLLLLIPLFFIRKVRN